MNGKFTDVFQTAGSAVVEVDPARHIHLAVETPYMAAVVKGTVFAVSTYDGYSETAVERGRVAVIDVKNRLHADVTAGQSATSGETMSLALAGPGTLAKPKAFKGRVANRAADGTLTETASDGTTTTTTTDGTVTVTIADGTVTTSAGKSASSNAGGNSANSNSSTNNAGGNSNGAGNSSNSNAGGNSANSNSSTNNAGGNSNGAGNSSNSNAGGKNK